MVSMLLGFAKYMVRESGEYILHTIKECCQVLLLQQRLHLIRKLWVKRGKVSDK